MFKDEVEIFVKAGDGGAGIVSFWREKYIPKGGPDGGNGGWGGDVIIRANPHMNTLYHLAHHERILAQAGQPGGSNNCIGKNGADRVVEVPLGTVVRDRANRNILKDLKDAKDEFIVVKGGRGGRGNKVFANAINQTPRNAETGAPGEERWLYLELKLIADVGLVGLPNAGKSTVLSRVSDARPKIADYPFTTLEPSLGVVAVTEDRTFVVADLPGLIEGAHLGKGLGDKFLKHIERTRIVLHIIDATTPLDAAYKTIREELKEYSPTLAKKPEILVLNKIDLPGAEANIKKYRAKLPKKFLTISAVKKTGLPELIRTLSRKLQTLKSAE
ncbi:MAG: GTPase ObgE [Candidatus Brocadiia bacterium]